MSEKSKLEKLEADLALAEKGLASDAIKNNPKLLNSLNTKISILKTQIGIEKNGGKATSKAQAPAKPATAKKEAPVTKKEAKKPVAKSEKKSTTVASGKYKVGDEVKFIERKSGKTLKGEIARIYKSYHSDKMIAVVNCDDKKREVYLHKLL